LEGEVGWGGAVSFGIEDADGAGVDSDGEEGIGVEVEKLCRLIH